METKKKTYIVGAEHDGVWYILHTNNKFYNYFGDSYVYVIHKPNFAKRKIHCISRKFRARFCVFDVTHIQENHLGFSPDMLGKMQDKIIFEKNNK